MVASGLGAPLRNEAWGKGGGAWGLPCPRIGWGRGETPQILPGRRGANLRLWRDDGTAGTPPAWDAPGAAVPPPPFHAFAPRRLRRGLSDTSCAGLSPAKGCGAQAPFGWLEKGQAHSSVAALDQQASPNLLPSSQVFWDHPWRALGVSVLHGQRKVGWRMGGGGCGGTPTPCWSSGCGTAGTSLAVYIRHAEIAWVSFGDGIWTLHPSGLGW